MAINSRNTIRIMFFSVLALLLLAIAMFVSMLMLHRDDIHTHSSDHYHGRSNVSVHADSCCITCPSCGDVLTITRLK